MPQPEEQFDAVAWVNQLEDYLREALLELIKLHPTDTRLTAVACDQFELGCMALERAVKKDTP